MGRAQLSQEFCLSVGFAAGMGLCGVKAALAGRILGTHPSGQALLEEPQDGSAVFDNYPQPRRLPHHREIDSPKTKTRQENIDAIPHMLIVQRRHCLRQRLWAVGVGPAVVQFSMRFFDAPRLHVMVSHQISVQRIGNTSFTVRHLFSGEGRSFAEVLDTRVWAVHEEDGLRKSPLPPVVRAILNARKESESAE